MPEVAGILGARTRIFIHATQRHGTSPITHDDVVG